MEVFLLDWERSRVRGRGREKGTREGKGGGKMALAIALRFKTTKSLDAGPLSHSLFRSSAHSLFPELVGKCMIDVPVFGCSEP